MKLKEHFTARNLALVGMLSALVFAASWISIPMGDTTRLHLGNIVCLTGGLVFGPWVGGLAAGLGSMLYDFTNPLFMPEFWITFIMKFAMGFIAGALHRRLQNRVAAVPALVLSALTGQAVYIGLYLFKSAMMQHFVLGNPWAAVGPVVALNAGVSTVNGAISVAGAVILAPVLVAALKKAGLFRAKKGA